MRGRYHDVTARPRLGAMDPTQVGATGGLTGSDPDWRGWGDRRGSPGPTQIGGGTELADRGWARPHLGRTNSNPGQAGVGNGSSSGGGPPGAAHATDEAWSNWRND